MTTRASEEKDRLILLCKDFDKMAFAAMPIEIITNLMNGYLSADDIQENKVSEVNNMICIMTTLMSFIAHLHESVEIIKHLESHE
jgi:hypothetical protein